MFKPTNIIGGVSKLVKKHLKPKLHKFSKLISGTLASSLDTWRRKTLEYLNIFESPAVLTFWRNVDLVHLSIM